MKVICIDDSEQGFSDEYPTIKKGKIYHVVGVYTLATTARARGYVFDPGDYYYLVETGGSVAYHHSAFIEVLEDDIDETELVNETEKTKVL